MTRKFAPKNGCSNFVDRIAVNGTDNESNSPDFEEAETKMSCGSSQRLIAYILYKVNVHVDL